MTVGQFGLVLLATILAVFLAVTGHLFYLTLEQLTETGPRGIVNPMEIMVRNVAFWLVYLSHFFVTPLLAAILWKVDRQRFRTFAVLVVILSFAGLATYALYPAAPPWMAAPSPWHAPTSPFAPWPFPRDGTACAWPTARPPSSSASSSPRWP